MGVGTLKHPAVFLDRDGVLNEAVVRDGRPFPPASATELQLMVDAEAELTRLARRIPLLFVVTNQPDVARGTQNKAAVEAINRALAERLPIREFYTCYHDDSDDCACRKPRAGSFHDAAASFGIDLPASFMVGDRWRDIDAGATAGCTTILINRGYDERPPSHPPDVVVGSLHEAVDAILARTSSLQPHSLEHHS